MNIMAEVKRMHELYLKVISNNGILHQLERYLSMQQFKALREVDTASRTIITHQSRFHFETVLRLGVESLPYLSSAVMPFYPPINLELHPICDDKLSYSLPERNAISRMVVDYAANCESLKIQATYCYAWTDPEKLPMIWNSFPKIRDVILAAPNLKRLALLSDAALFTNSCTLEDLERISGIGITELEISTQCLPNALSNFRGLRKIILKTSEGGCDELQLQKLKEIMMYNAETLTSIVGMDEALDPERNYPNLAVVKMKIDVVRGPWIEFLQNNLGNIQELSFNVNIWDSLNWGSNLIALRNICNTIHSSNPRPRIRKFQITAFGTGIIIDEYLEVGLPLEEFSLHNNSDYEYNGSDVYKSQKDMIALLPPSLKSLVLKGDVLGHSIEGFEENDVPLNPEYLPNLTHVTKLELRFVHGVYDGFVQQVCTHLLSLKILTLDGLFISANAFLDPENPSGEDNLLLPKLKELVELNLLQLRFAALTLLPVIKFPYLRRLAISEINPNDENFEGPSFDFSNGLILFLLQNPSLETLSSEIDSNIVEIILSAAKRHGMRIPHIRYEQSPAGYRPSLL